MIRNFKLYYIKNAFSQIEMPWILIDEICRILLLSSINTLKDFFVENHNFILLLNRDPMEEIMQAYSYYRPATGRTLLYSNFGRDEQLSPGE